jgi:MFS family permease
MQYISPPAIWLIVLIAGIGQLSETVYSPALPAIAASLGVKASWVEYTLTIYLLSFGIGTLFWGRLSDHFGRKPCVLAGLAIYILGSLGCYMADSLSILMISRSGSFYHIFQKTKMPSSLIWTKFRPASIFPNIFGPNMAPFFPPIEPSLYYKYYCFPNIFILV